MNVLKHLMHFINMLYNTYAFTQVGIYIYVEEQAVHAQPCDILHIYLVELSCDLIYLLFSANL